MKRSSGVTASAVIAIIGSVVSFLMGGLMVVTSIMAHNNLIPASNPALPAPPISPAVTVGFLAVFYAGFGVWGIVSAVGLLRLRNWARVCFAVYGGLLAVFSVFGAIAMGIASFIVPQAMPPDINAPPGFIQLILAVFAFVALLGVALGVWWVIYFNRQKVKEQFLGEEAAASPRQFPLSIAIIAWILSVGGVLFLPYAILSLPAIIFGYVFRGSAARIIYLLFAIVSLLSGIGMLRKRPAAHSLAVGYFLFGLMNSIATFLIPGSKARLQDFLDQLNRGQPLPIPMNSFFMMSILFGVVTVGVGLWFLMKRKQAFVEACSK